MHTMLISHARSVLLNPAVFIFFVLGVGANHTQGPCIGEFSNHSGHYR